MNKLPSMFSSNYRNVMIDGKNVFDQPVKNDVRTYNIKKIATDKGNDYTRWAKKNTTKS